MYIAKHYYPSIGILIPIIMFIIGIFMIIKSRNPYVEQKMQMLIFGVVFLVGGLFVTATATFEYILLYNDVWLQYKKGNYNQCSGTVENLEIVSYEGNGNDEFYVNGIAFSIGDTHCPGYQKLASHGGLINKEGINVNLKYVEYGEFKYIMEINILK